ncbi:MAG TPA: STAS domain-containing protein [Candidatus Polarisedimenticolia bacterium]|nr:STAS domain-containing protein [Candidatus Polarisedimenticolia bacterium]
MLEGRILAEGAHLLERECFELLSSRDEVSVDLTQVSFVDKAGVKVLLGLNLAGVEIRCRPGAVASVLEGEGIHLTLDQEFEGGQPP